MTSVSKIRFFLITTALVFSITSCNKENDVIPDVYVDFTIDIFDPQFVNLNALGGSDTIDAHTNNWGARSAGYGGNGIIVTAGVNEFYAYDRTCPHDYEVNNTSVQIRIDKINFAKAVCPSCGTVYELLSYGTPSSGIGRYPLKNYKTSFDGRNIWVRNGN